ncbi:glutathione S-transferase [Aphelenchoides avenae]|nr:glutathione S-transferase [Aphelenchus avenae]
MDCYSANPTCNEAMWEMWGTECVWCAKNNTPGFAVDAEYTKLQSSWNCSDGVVVTDICPPSVTQVTRSGSTFEIEGQYFGNYLRIGPANYTNLTISACGQTCYFGEDAITDTRITCQTQGSPDCHDVLLRGKVKDSPQRDAIDTINDNLKRSSLPENMTLPYTMPPNRELTLRHEMSDTTTSWKLLLVAGAVVAVIGFVLNDWRIHKEREEYIITPEKLKNAEEIHLGEGQFGKVFQAEYHGAKVAVKELRDEKAATSDMRAFAKEIEMLRHLHHPMIVCVWGFMTRLNPDGRRNVSLVMEWCHCSLRYALDRRRSSPPEWFDAATTLDFCRDIAAGMKYLHDQNPPLLHRDLKCANILLTDANEKTLKICDFGLSVIGASKSRGEEGTTQWMAPELFNSRLLEDGAHKYTTSSDVFAYGACLYELLTYQLPYSVDDKLQDERNHQEQQPSSSLRVRDRNSDKGTTELGTQIGNGDLRLKSTAKGMRWDIYPELPGLQLPVLMERCAAYYAKDRPSFEEVCYPIRHVKMVHYKLVYFDGRGAAETSRLLFAHEGAEYEDVRITQEEWANKKSEAPFGKLPWLEVDGKKLPESHAINRYLARKFGLAGKDEWEQAWVDAIADLIKDLGTETSGFIMVAFGFKEGDKDKLRKDVFDPAVERVFALLEKFIKESGSGFLVKSGYTWVDFLVAEMLVTDENIAPGCLDKHSELKAYKERVHSIPKIKDYVASRKTSVW